MTAAKNNRAPWAARASVFVTVAVLIGWATIAVGTGENHTRQLREAQQRAVKNAGGFYGASLEMRENVDFLLTPALLVQEAIDEGAVITYPNE